MINLYLIEKAFILFILYSFIGWIIETTLTLIESKKFVNRGFLMGPICPVYGVGAIIITGVLYRYSNDFLVIFGLSVLMCGCLEYFTSYLMEKIFHARWWDYSNFKYNINGRICLDTLILFGLAGILIFKLTNPLFDYLIFNNISNDVLNIICIVFGIILTLDIVFSFIIINKIKDISTIAQKENKDNTEDISKKVREIIMEKSMPYRRVLEAFPHVFADKVKEGKQKIVNTATKAKEKTIENINNVKDNLNNAKERTKENFNNARERTKENFNNAKEKTIENINNAKERTKKTIKYAKLKTLRNLKIYKEKDNDDKEQ